MTSDLTASAPFGRLSASISRVGSIDAVETLWRDLERRGATHFFSSWTWAGAWLRIVGDETEVHLFECRDGDQLVALGLLTLTEARRLQGHLKIRQLQLNQFLSDGFTMVMGYNGLLCERGMEEAAWTAFLRAAQEWNSHWDEIALSSLSAVDLDRVTRVDERLHLWSEKTFVTWRVDLDNEKPDLEGSIGRLKRKSRQQARQSFRALGQIGDVTLRAAVTREKALEYFDRLGHLHTRRWNVVGKSGSFANPKWVRFHRDIIGEGFALGQIQLLEIACGTEPIGYLYGHVYGHTVFMHQTGFRTSSDNRVRPGVVCHIEAMRYNASRGVRFYDLLPDEFGSYKSFFAKPGLPIHWVTLQRPRTKLRIEYLLRALRDRAGRSDVSSLTRSSDRPN